MKIDPNSYEWQYKVARALHHQRLHPPAILRSTLTMICEAIGVSFGCIVTFDEDDALRHTYLIGIELDGEAASGFWKRLINQGIIGFVQHGQRVVVIRNISTDPRWPQLPTSARVPQTGSAVGIPIKSEDQLLGTIVLLSPEVDYFDSDLVRILEEIADIVAGALNNANMLETSRNKEISYRRMIDKAQSEKAEAARHEQLRRDLAAMTYHDIRNPLQNIQISLAGLERLLSNSEKSIAVEMIRLAQRSAQQITRMVRGLLDIERLEQGRTMLNVKPTTLETLLVEAVEMVRPVAEEAGQSLNYECDPDLPALHIDADMIQRVITNLMENAVKHTPSNGHITVSARLMSDSIRISVADTGPGVPRHFKDEIFDKFFRIKYSNAPNGVGLGLAFCRLAVEAHGGRIWVESEPGSGAVFAFTLPVSSTSVGAMAHPATAAG
ncbi:MAG TPA: ATP-binding protein [Oceanobacillus sp.]|nr:ATP-binding protein [Oceanobacillus sp.]